MPLIGSQSRLAQTKNLTVGIALKMCGSNSVCAGE